MKLDSVGGRRWITAIGLIAAASGMLLAGRITGAQWVELVTWVYGIFGSANVIQRGVEAAKDVKTMGGKQEPEQ